MLSDENDFSFFRAHTAIESWTSFETESVDAKLVSGGLQKQILYIKFVCEKSVLHRNNG